MIGRGLVVLLVVACSAPPRAPAPEPAIPPRDAATMVGGLFELRLRPDKVAEAKTYFAAQTARILRDEPGTLALVWFTLADPSQIAIYEVYADRPALDAHNAKPEMAELKTKIPELIDLTTMKAVSLVEPGIGFVRVGGDPIPCDALAGTVHRFAAAPDLDAKLRTSTTAAQATPGTLVDVAFHSKADASQVIELAIYRDERARGSADGELAGHALMGFVR